MEMTEELISKLLKPLGIYLYYDQSYGFVDNLYRLILPCNDGCLIKNDTLDDVIEIVKHAQYFRKFATNETIDNIYYGSTSLEEMLILADLN